ncbi:hypothetical protein N865_02280 [Intrasporangium oryzae NRRL B-24470]|uniref:Permease n=1 Tax=Intrasporangium oryzae NRRL B-24470 TaxID=1386089 RepID=W9G168_9MICO|nr:hypothetical protein [Intrasporangium oryzae]EWS99840.1 hypothetical protein N865_02280 [Intrasporangium oryzae NRRL B-24470]
MTTVPDDNAASRPGERAAQPEAAGTGPLTPPLPATEADRLRPVTVAFVVVGAAAVLVASLAGSGAVLGVTLVLVLLLAFGWPELAGSYTPGATSVILALSGVVIVLTALRDDLRWVAAAVALGIVLSFFGQLVRRTGREGLVLTLLASFGGLVLIASGATAVPLGDDASGAAVLAAAMAGVVGGLAADLLAPAARARPGGSAALAAAALVGGGLVALAAALVLDTPADGLATAVAVGVGALSGIVSWGLRRVLSLQPAMVEARGQLAAGVGSVLAVGAIAAVVAAAT